MEDARLPADDPRRRPEGVDDDTVEAVGKLTEAFEFVERARGSLYDVHQLMGRADLLFGEAVDLLDDAGHTAQAERLRDQVVGRNLLEGRWTFQIVEEVDDAYYDPVRAEVRSIEAELLDGRRHVYEAEMKERRRTHGRRGHERHPPKAADAEPS